MGYDEAARLRQDDEAWDDELARDPGGAAPCGSPCVVLKTATQTTYPTTANVWYHCLLVDVTGTQTEGAAATRTDSAKAVQAYNLGSGVPPAGTYVVGCFVPYGWTFRYP